MGARRIAQCVCLLALLSLGSDLLARPQVPTYSSRTVGVRLDVTVMDGTSAVHGLTAQDFDVVDNGRRQQISLTETSDAPLDLVLVLQPRTTLTPRRQEIVARGLQTVRGLLKESDRLGSVLATAPPRALSGLVPVLPRTEMTLLGSGEDVIALRDAALHGLTLFDAEDRRKAVVLFTDGQHDRSWATEAALVSAADRLPAQCIVAAVDVTWWTSSYTVWNDGRRSREETRHSPAGSSVQLPQWLIDVARRTGGRIVDLRSSEAAEAQLHDVITRLRTQYVLTYAPDVVGAGWHSVKVSLKKRRGSVIAREGYWAPSPGTSPRDLSDSRGASAPYGRR
jgi:VWFA-related protein